MRELSIRREVAYMFRNRLLFRRIPYIDRTKTTILVPENVYEECLGLLKEVERMAAGRKAKT